MQAPKGLGGLGVGSLAVKNSSLLFKWWWRFSQEPQSLWCSVIRAIHNIPADSFLPLGNVPRCPGSWKTITDTYNAPQQARLVFWKSITIELGNGSSILFWHHPWFESAPLKERFKDLYDISSCKRAAINQVYMEAGDIVSWDLTWLRPLMPNEISVLVRLRELIQYVRLPNHGRDRVGWNDCHRQRFDTKSQSQDTYLEMFADLNHDKIVNEAWCNLVPPRVQFHMWLVLHGKVHTRDRLVRKGILPSDQNVCPLCSNDKETDHHLFIHYPRTYELWSEPFSTWNIQKTVPENPRSLLQMWLYTPVKGDLQRKIWRMVFYAIIWITWLTRNDIVFNNGSWSPSASNISSK